MSATAARISKKRGKELFSVEIVNTQWGKRYAVVSHREKFGQDMRIILARDDPDAPNGYYPLDPFGLEKAKRIAKKYRTDAEAARNEQKNIQGTLEEAQ